MSTLNMALQVLVAAQENELAAKVIDGLDRLDEKPESAKRWIWELIQNAKDASLGPNRPPVKIEILLTKDKVEFRHSGNPFTLKDLVSLICQTSMKERSMDENEIPENTGKFGTGFITTHMLSRVIEIRGVYQSEEGGEKKFQNFELVLDRATQDKQEMIRRNKKAFEMFARLDNKESNPFIENYQSGIICDTVFSYKLDENSILIAQQGIKDFKNSVFQMLIFNPRIASIHLIDKVSNTEDFYKIEKVTDIIGGICRQYEVSNKAVKKHFIQASTKFTTACIEIQITENSCTVIPKPYEAPILFADFPLVGSEHFYSLPCYLNSHIFWPNEERSSVQIIQKNRYLNNKRIFKESVDLMFSLFNYASYMNWEGLHNFARIDVPTVTNSNWFEFEVMKPYMKLIANQDIIKTASGGRTTLLKAILPVYDSLEYQKLPQAEKEKMEVQKQRFSRLWMLLSEIYKKEELVCSNFEYYQTWEDILKSQWMSILPKENQATFQAIYKHIHNCENLNSLQLKLPTINKEEWLCQSYRYLIDFISPHHLEIILRDYKLFINQKYQFRNLSQLYRDQEIEDIYKELCLKYGYDLYSILLANICNKEVLWFTNKFGRAMSFQDVEKHIYEAITYQSKQTKGSKTGNYLKLQKVWENNSEWNSLIFNLVAALPQVNKQIDDDETIEFKQKREDFYYFMIQFTNIPPMKYVNTYQSRIYFEIESIILKWICRNLNGIQNLSQLVDRLRIKKNREKAILWLNKFYSYYISLPYIQILNEKIILNEKEEFVKFEVPRKLNIDSIVAWVNEHKEMSEKSKSYLQDNESMIRDLYHHFVFLNKEKCEDLESGLIHPEVKDTLMKDSRISSKAEKVTIKDLMNEIDKAIQPHGKNTDFIARNSEKLWQIETICDTLQANGSVLSELLPQYQVVRKDIFFELLTGSKKKETLTKILTSEFGEGIIQNVSQMNAESQKAIHHITELMQSGEISAKELLELAQNKKKKDLQVNFIQNSDSDVNEDEDEDQDEDEDSFIKTFNLNDFCLENCITSNDGLIACIKKFKPHHQDFLKSISPNKESFLIVQKKIKRSVESVKNILKSQCPPYDISNWQIVTNQFNNPNNNIVHGVTKNGAPIKIVVRPTDCGRLMFHNEDEICTLKESGAELWGDDGDRTRQIMLGEIVSWNMIREVRIEM